MGGYRTWERSWAGDQLGAQYYCVSQPSLSETIPAVTIHPGGSQSTYSYRTGRSSGADSKDYEFLSGPELRGRVMFEHRTQYDAGHEFRTSKLNCTGPTHSSVVVPYDTGGRRWEYRGPLWCSIVGDPYSSAGIDPTPSVIEGWGNDAISQTIPTESEASLAQFMGELRERFPSVPGAQFLYHGIRNPQKTAGDEFLNLEFGVKPMIKDITDLASSVINFRKIVDQFDRDSKQWIRRKKMLADTSDTSLVVNGPGNVAAFSSVVANATNPISRMFSGVPLALDKRIEFSQRVWFSGCYTYYLHKADSFMDRVARYEQLANKLLGSRITPSTVWELTPWSWLIDWHVDVGSYLRSLEAFRSDSLTLRYGYLMCETRTKIIYTVPVNMKSRLGTYFGSPSVSFEKSSKTRTRANPYGFGSTSNYSPRQWAILGALGLSRSPGRLRTD
jgi:hypothetical protein